MRPSDAALGMVGLGMVVLGMGCRQQAAPAAVVRNADVADAGGAGEDRAEGDRAAKGSSADPVVGDRNLWFADGPGRQAILAREHRDHDAAIRHLDALLAQPEQAADDRGAAQWLRGLEDMRLAQYEAAAERFAEARKAPALASVSVRLGVLEAQARLRAGDPKTALAIARGLDATGTPHQSELLIVVGDAQLRTDDFAGARGSYEHYLRGEGNRGAEVRSKLAKALRQLGGNAELLAAVGHYETNLLNVPLSDYGAEAEKELPALRRAAGVRADPEFARKVELARMDAMVARRRYDEAVRSADAILARGGSGSQRCHALFAKGSATFKQRERAKSRPIFEKAAAACKRAGAGMDATQVKARYQAGRGLYAEGKYTHAAKAFEALAKDHPTSSYVDDALILAGESWEEAGKRKDAQRVYRAALAAGGDMEDEARRRLLVMAFADADFQAALKVTTDGLAAGRLSPTQQAKLSYFQGRALAALSRPDEATAAWLQTIDALPLGYAALQALSRLREQSPEALTSGLARLLDAEAGDNAGVGALPASPAAARALLLARLGLGEQAREELAVANVDGWPAAAVLNDAGLFSEAQRLVANLGSAWRRTPPVGAAEGRWRAAYPRPFSELVYRGEREHAVPPLLTWAIMQTESRFDPGVTSWAGARGLVQLMPATAEGLAKAAGVEIAHLDALYDPGLNLSLGQRYLGDLTARFGGDSGAAALAIPSYNGGAGNVDKWLAQRGDWALDLFIEAIPFDETRRYTQSVLGRWMAYRWLYTEGEPAARIPFLPQPTPKRG